MNLNQTIDQMLLKPQATLSEIVTLCEEARTYSFKSVCVNPTNIVHAKQLLKGSNVLVCTVIGFPLGANTVETKVFETKDAIEKGADEIEMVINIGRTKMHDYDYVEDEIRQVVKASGGKIVKVILETCLLTDEEKVEVCKRAVHVNASFVNTSTGFSTKGATKEDIALMRKTVGEKLGVKASGGIHSNEDALVMIQNGATRIGTSNGVIIVNYEQEKK